METVKKLAETTAEKITERSNPFPNTFTTGYGCPIADLKNSLTAGPHGPVVLQDNVLLEKVTRFTREKIPARNVHALGAGCYGTFTVTNDISKYSMANVFSQVGKKTDLFCRMSGTFTEQGDPDTLRDLRGFALKLYTDEGNWDLMTINAPVFLNRDMKTGPDGVHAMKRDPRTGMWNPTQTWDFVATHPESLHFFTMLYTDRVGTPTSFRHMHGFACNTFSFINAQKERFWVKFHLVCQQEVSGFDLTQSKLVMTEDTNWLGRDLHDAIEKGHYPKWKLCVQIMPEERGYSYPFTFDASKVWPHDQFPLIDIGIIELNRNPVDYFAEVEQVAFSPARVVPGIGFSPDRLLQGRLLVYDDAQYHRIGPNHQQLQVNAPKYLPNTLYLGGNMQLEVKDKFPHYYPSYFSNTKPDPKYAEPPLRVDGPVGYYDLPYEGTDEDFYAQPRNFYSLLSEKEKQNTIINIADSLRKVDAPEVVNKVLEHFRRIDTRLGEGISEILKGRQEGSIKKADAEMLVYNMNAQIKLEASH